MRALLRFELAAARRARTVTLFAAGFALASLAVALMGLSAGGAVTVQGFARTSVSLLQLVVWVVPVAALLTGAVAGAECHELEFVIGLPLTRGQLLKARWAAWTLALGGALFVGLGAAGIVIALLAGAADGARYLALMLVAWLLLAATLALGLAIGVTARTRARAVGIAIVTWFVLVVGVDLVAIGLLAILPPRDAGGACRSCCSPIRWMPRAPSGSGCFGPTRSPGRRVRRCGACWGMGSGGAGGRTRDLDGVAARPRRAVVRAARSLDVSPAASRPAVLISEAAIAARVDDLARQISADYAGLGELLLVGVLRGAFIFSRTCRAGSRSRAVSTSWRCPTTSMGPRRRVRCG
jgi:hypothetical protein